MSSALVSFIIPYRGRRDLLLATLASIAALDWGNDRIQIVVVSQESDLDGAVLARHCQEQSHCVIAYQDTESSVDSQAHLGGQNDTRVTLRVLKRPVDETVSALRNRGASTSEGRYLAFLDADIALAPNWLTAMRGLLAARSTRVITSGAQALPLAPTNVERIRVALSNLAVDTNVNFLPGCNLFLARDTFLTLDGFPEHLATCEDYWFTNNASKIGELYRSSAASYVHLGEDKTYLGMARKEMWRGQSNLYSVIGRRIRADELASLVVPLWVLLGTALVLPALVLARGAVLVIVLVATFLPIFLYSMRLKIRSKYHLGIIALLWFYTLYFPTRGLSMLLGIAKRF